MKFILRKLLFNVAIVGMGATIISCSGSNYGDIASSSEVAIPEAVPPELVPSPNPVVEHRPAVEETNFVDVKPPTISFGSKDIAGQQVSGAITIGAAVQTLKGSQLGGQITINQ